MKVILENARMILAACVLMLAVPFFVMVLIVAWVLDVLGPGSLPRSGD